MSNNPNFYLPRTCSKVSYSNEGKKTVEAKNIALESLRDCDAYVLLAEPGAGKTESFKNEALEINCIRIKASDFISLDVHAGWRSKTLFIDGLDEVRAGVSNGVIPLNAIRNQLLKLGKPKFRLSCREADWLDSSDEEDMRSVTANNDISILHLESFTDNDISVFIAYKNPAINIEQFLDWRDKHQLTSLLANPQLLTLIVKAIGESEDNWPKNKQDIFKIASEKLTAEENESHSRIKSNTVLSSKQLEQIAGKLFAHQLIAGLEGYSLSSTESSVSYPYYKRVFDEGLNALDAALKTNLFKSSSSSDLREPIHRSLAEYLAAQYLNELVENQGLPVRRMLALMTTVDGTIAASLRGLFAWFTCLCPTHREQLLSRDPLGIILYGDVNNFSITQKKQLFTLLYEESKLHTGFRNDFSSSVAFGGLATKDMESTLNEFLLTTARDDVSQVLVNCVLDAIENGAQLPNINNTLINIIKDHSWWGGNRQSALRSFLESSASNKNDLIVKLLKDIQQNSIEDREDELLGEILSQLYPTIIGTEEIFDYFHMPKNDHLMGSYMWFWRHKIVENTPVSLIPQLLDSLSQNQTIQSESDYHYSRYDFMADLLLKGIINFGDEISVKQLYCWLGIGLDQYGNKIYNQDEQASKFKQWLDDRPHLYTELLKEGLLPYLNEGGKRQYFDKIIARFYNAKAPQDIGFWYLDQAEKTLNKDMSEVLFDEAILQITYAKNNQLFNLDHVIDWVKKNDSFKQQFERSLFVDGKQYQQILKRSQIRHEHSSGDIKRETDYINYIKKNKHQIQAGSAHSSIFHDIAMAYYARLSDIVGETAEERIFKLMHNSNELTLLAFEGLKKIIFREDIPSVKKIIQTAIEKRTYHINHAVLASLDLRVADNKEDWKDISDVQIEKAVAIYLVEYTNETPKWLECFLQTKTDLISRIIIQYISSSVSKGKEYITGTYQLENDPLWSKVARLSTLQLLQKWPVRSKNAYSNYIESLLKAALKYSDKDKLVALIELKLSKSSMNASQRSLWFATGLVALPEKYEPLIIQRMNESVNKTREIAHFFSDINDHWNGANDLPISTQSLIVEKLGQYYKPYTVVADVSNGSLERNVSGMVRNTIQKLGRANNPEASKQLDKLKSLSELSEWSYELKSALYESAKRLNDASFIQLGFDDISNTLANKEPSNAADLMAITLDHLETIAEQIQNGNNNGYEPYWNTDSHNRVINPKTEEVCRNALLAVLEGQLAKQTIDAERESYFSRNKRSDIKVSFLNKQKFIIPIEIKKEEHDDLWTALWDQLIPLYTRSPNAYGYGIYLVFWFGYKKTKGLKRKTPASAQELKDMLIDMMSEEEKRLIGVCVIDCSVR